MDEKLMAFLYEATKVLPKNDNSKFIRSQLLAKCYSTNLINRPAQNFKQSVMCHTCGIELIDVPPKVKIKAAKKPCRFVRKLLRTNGKPLTKYQMKRLKVYEKKCCQKLIRTCRVCHKTSITKLSKPNALTKTHKIGKQTAKKRKLHPNLNENNQTVSPQQRPHQNLREIQNINSVHNLRNSRNSNNSNSNLHSNQTGLSQFQRGRNIQASNTNKSEKGRSTEVRKQNKVKSGRIEKNEVLRKTEKDTKKKAQRLKNLTDILQTKPTTTSSLQNFLKSI